MAHNRSQSFQIAEKPWVVQATDADLVTFLAGLNGGGASDLAEVEETIALWAVEVPNGTEPGTCYVVSPETFKYVIATRY